MTKAGLACLVAATCVVSMPIAVAAQRRGGHGPMRPAPTIGSQQPSLNRPSFPLDGLNRPSFPLDGLNRPSFPLHGLNRPSFPINEPNRPSFPINGPPGIGHATSSPFDARRGTYAPRFSQSHGPRSFGIPLDYGFGVPGYYVDTGTSESGPAASEAEAVNGTLVVDVTPRTAMVFVDSAYMGAVDDLLFNGVSLSRGRHWLEIEAPGYEKTLIEINITPGQPLRYRADLSPERRASLPVIPSRPPETMYAIPGCYGGNRPPVAATLPPGCDIAKVRVLRPQRPN